MYQKLLLILGIVLAFTDYTFTQSEISSELFSDLKYRNVGPSRGGRVTAVTGVPGELFTYYMGATGGGVWKTTDGGLSWNNISDGFIKAGSIGAITIAPTDKNVIYDMGGNLQEEISVRKKTNMDYIMSSKSLDKYPEGKVLALRKVTKFNLQGISNPQSYYEVSVKNGKEIVYVYFDDDKQLMKNDNVFNLAVN